jgi:hypothetical protein
MKARGSPVYQDWGASWNGDGEPLSRVLDWLPPKPLAAPLRV